MKSSSAPRGSRSFSTSSRRRIDGLEMTSASTSEVPLPPINFRDIKYEDGGQGHKFGIPQQIPRTDHLKRRYDPAVEQLTKTLMRNGKLSAAQRVCGSHDVCAWFWKQANLLFRPSPIFSISSVLQPHPNPSPASLATRFYLQLALSTNYPCIR